MKHWKEDFSMAFVALLYGIIVNLAGFWAAIEIFFTQLFGA